MDIISAKGKLSELIKKYKYVALVLLIGLVLMMLPTGKRESTPQASAALQQPEEPSVNEALAGILSTIEGAGKVQVFLTVAAGEQTIYQTDERLSKNGESTDTQSETVIITDDQRNEIGLVRQVNPPIYQGAIVVCQGADSPVVQLSIVDAVSKVTGLGADRISVLKMK